MSRFAFGCLLFIIVALLLLVVGKDKGWWDARAYTIERGDPGADINRPSGADSVLS